MNKKLSKQIKQAFDNTDFTVKFGEGWINIMRSDGMHCEFYNCWGENPKETECYLTSTYIINNRKTDIDLHMPSQLNEFVAVVSKILE